MKITICAQLDLNFESVPRFPTLHPARRQNRRRNLRLLLLRCLGLGLGRRPRTNIERHRPAALSSCEAGALVRYNQFLS
jgi:hypothetical protein